MSTTLTDVGALKSWASPNADAARDDELQACLDRAVSWIEGMTGRTLEAPATAYTEVFNAGYCGGDTIYLNRGRSPVIHTTAPNLVTVTENGVTLSVGTGYQTAKDVILIGANEDLPCRLVRYSGPWTSGVQNVSVTYFAGWTSATIPARIVHLILEVAHLIFRSPDWIGKSNVSQAGAAVSFEKDLSPLSRMTLASLTVNW